jgi:hypothetical protein
MSKKEIKYTAWVVRGIKKLNNELLKPGIRIVIIKSNGDIKDING